MLGRLGAGRNKTKIGTLYLVLGTRPWKKWTSLANIATQSGIAARVICRTPIAPYNSKSEIAWARAHSGSNMPDQRPMPGRCVVTAPRVPGPENGHFGDGSESRPFLPTALVEGTTLSARLHQNGTGILDVCRTALPKIGALRRSHNAPSGDSHLPDGACAGLVRKEAIGRKGTHLLLSRFIP